MSAISEVEELSYDQVKDVREEIPCLNHQLYFNTGTLGPSPESVTEAFFQAYRRWQELGPGNPDIYEEFKNEVTGDLKKTLARYLRVKPQEVALLGNSTDGVNVVVRGINWRPGDEIIISDQEHPAVFLPWYNLARQKGVKIRQLPLQPDVGNMMARLEELINARTRMICLSHVTCMTGLKLPVAKIVRLARDSGVLTFFDGAQACGQFSVDLSEIDPDFYTLNGHKWLLGPVGTGALYVKEDRVDELRPSWTGGGAIQPLNYRETDRFTFHSTAKRYEFGTRNWALCQGWKEALDRLEELGWSKIQARVRRLVSQFMSGVREIEGARQYCRLNEIPTGLVTLAFDLERSAEEISRDLRHPERDMQVITRPVKEIDGVRFSIAFFNTSAEIERLLFEIEDYIQSRS